MLVSLHIGYNYFLFTYYKNKMWLLNFFSGQAIDVIRWENPESYLLIKKFDRPFDEIKDDATLIVEPWQAAIFIHNWKIEAVQTEPWKWSLETENIPFITAFKNILRWWESPDKSSVFFIKTTEILNQKWGTKNPVKYVDPIYNFPIKLRAFWNFSFKIKDLVKFWENFVWTRNELTIDEVRDLIVDRILQYITDTFAESKLSYNEIDANRLELANKIKEKLNEHLWDLWLEITDFRIEDINFSDETEKLIQKIADKTADSHAINQMENINSEAMKNYATTRQLDALEKAAENEWTAWAMVWTVVWVNMGSNMNITNTNNDNESIEAKLEKLKNLLDKWLISKEDYEKKKSELLNNI